MKRTLTVLVLAFLAGIVLTSDPAEARDRRRSYNRYDRHQYNRQPYSPPYRSYVRECDPFGQRPGEYFWTIQEAEQFLRELDELEEVAASQSGREWRPSYRRPSSYRSSRCHSYHWDRGEVIRLQEEVARMRAYLGLPSGGCYDASCTRFQPCDRCGNQEFYSWSANEVKDLDDRMRDIRSNFRRMGR